MEDQEAFHQRRAVIYERGKLETQQLAVLNPLIHAFFQDPSEQRYNEIESLINGSKLWLAKVAAESKQRQEDFEVLQQKRKETREEYKQIRLETIEAKKRLIKAQMIHATNDKCVALAKKVKKLPSIKQIHEDIKEVEEEICAMEEASQKMSEEIDGFNTRIAVGVLVVDQIGDHIFKAISTRSPRGCISVKIKKSRSHRGRGKCRRSRRKSGSHA